MKQPASTLTGFDKVRVLVIGDLMLDKFSYGKVSRISPEAPVPVLHIAREDTMLGGAANVACNVSTLGAQPVLIGVIGDDKDAQTFRGLLGTFGDGIEDGTISIAGRPTTTKLRLVAQGQQIVRADSEQSQQIDPDTEEALIDCYEAALETCDIVCVSDYGKGVLTDRVLEAVFATAKKACKSVIVDPKRVDFAGYAGAQFIKPNASELSRATGLRVETDDEAAVAARKMISLTGADILCTRSEKGISLFRAGAEPLHMATQAREVYDVSGAGDTVMAAFAIATAADRPMPEAVRIANTAAGIVVMRQGTATVTAAELDEAMRKRRHHGRSDAAQGWTDAAAIRHVWADRGLTVGFTNGCFDIIHPGHISLLRQAAKACDRLIVGLNTDASVKRLKGETRPFQPEHDRATVMAALEMVDLVVLFDDDTPLELIRRLMPDVLVKGADYRPDQVVGADVVTTAGGRLELVDLVEGRSTSNIARRASFETAR